MSLARYLRRWMAAAILLVCGCAAAGSQNPSGATIPVTRGKTLSGETILLPQSLKGKTGVLVLGFSQASREQVTAWGKRLAGRYAESTAVVYYEMPVLEQVPRILRGWVLKKISEAVPERAKGRFLPVTEQEKEWKTAAMFAGPDDAYVLIVDENGLVRWTLHGPSSDEAYRQVEQDVELLIRR